MKKLLLLLALTFNLNAHADVFADQIVGSTAGLALMIGCFIPGVNTTMTMNNLYNKKGVANIILDHVDTFRAEGVLNSELRDAITALDNEDESIEDELETLETWAVETLN